MNRDAKIGVVVILVIVGLLVIIWGRGEPTGEESRVGQNDLGNLPVAPPANRLDAATSPAGASLGDEVRAVSPQGALVVPHDELPLPDETLMPAQLEGEPTAASMPESRPSAEPEYWYYTVVPGDTLELIASEQLGDRECWKEIAKLNNLPDPYIIHVDEKLKMPPKEGMGGTAAAPSETSAEPAAPSAGQRTYTIKKGDGLMQIAREQLGDARRWKEIAELNHLATPDRIKAGEVLLLPE